ncbi:UNVERIFIED_CONTAM: hypothetical protein FKN15_058514 [Acipenser sinensis]
MKCLREKGQGPRIDQYFLRSQSSQSNEIQRQEANHSSQDISTPVIDVRRTCMDTVSDEPNDPCEPGQTNQHKREKNLNGHKPGVKWPRACSTDCICYATVGVNDPVTSALHIIVGDTQPMDVCSVHHHNTFLKYSVSLLGYGFYGDVLTDSERNRWMGPARYDFSGFKTFLSHHCYEGTISFLPATNTLGSPRDSSRCRSGCYVCQHRVKDISPIKWGGGDVNENGTRDRCYLRLVYNELHLLAKGQKSLDLKQSAIEWSYAKNTHYHIIDFDLTFVEVYRVKKFKFTPNHCDSEFSDIRDVRENAFGQICRDHPSCDCTPVNSNWNCDGEILEHAAIEVGYGIYFFVN